MNEILQAQDTFPTWNVPVPESLEGRNHWTGTVHDLPGPTAKGSKELPGEQPRPRPRLDGQVRPFHLDSSFHLQAHSFQKNEQFSIVCPL